MRLLEYSSRKVALAMRWRAKVFWRRLKAAVLGWRCFCPVCESRVSAFMPMGAQFLETAIRHGWPYGLDSNETCNVPAYSCPECGASDRDRLMALYIDCYLKNVSSTPSAHINILEFAPQKGLSLFIKRSMKRHGVSGVYRTTDLSRGDVDLQMDICDMHVVPTKSVNLFICSHVLEHVADDKKALKELFRILAPGGLGILMVPISLSIETIDEDPAIISETERWKRFGQGDHVRLYSKKGFVDRLKKSGFVVREIGLGYFGDRKLHRCGIASKSILYVVQTG